MNREELKALGLTDEQIDKIMAAYGKAINDIKKKADKVDGLAAQVDNYEKDLAERDKQLGELGEKAKDNEELAAEIERLKGENESTRTAYEEKLNEQMFEHKIETTLSGAKVKNTKAVRALLDLDMIKLDGDKLKGLDEQLKTLKESDSYLFEEDKNPDSPIFLKGGNPKGDSGEINPFTKEHWNLTEQGKLYTNDPERYKILKAQAGR